MARPEQLPAYLREVVSTFLARAVELPDGVFLTVTRVDVPHRHETATAWVSVLPPERGAEVLRTLQRHLYDLQGTVNAHVSARPAPRVTVRLDRGPAAADRIGRLARTLR